MPAVRRRGRCHDGGDQKYSPICIAIVLLIFTGYPFLYMVATSFKTQEQFFMDPFSLFTSIQFSNYTLAFEKGLTTYFFNSVIVTAISVVLTVFIASLASYPLSRLKFRLNKPVFLLLVSGMMLPIHSFVAMAPTLYRSTVPSRSSTIT